MNAKLAFTLSLLATALVFAVRANAAEPLKIGDAGPDFANIIGVDDKEHSLADYKDSRLVVIVFTCNHCPVAQAYEDRLVELQSSHDPKDVRLIAVNVNNIPADRLEPMKERAKEKKFNFPYLYDSSQKIGRDYGAKVTPHVFLLDKQRKLAYTGAVDDSMKADKVKKHYLSDAIDALLKGEEPEETVTKQFGCGIKYDKTEKE